MGSMTEEEIKNLMKSDAYLNSNHPQHDETIKNVMQGWENRSEEHTSELQSQR